MAHSAVADPRLFAGGASPLGELIDGFDWGATGLGPVAGWPPVLRNTVRLIMGSPVAIATLWGPGGVMVYNDAYAGIIGARHPQLLGARVREGWPELASFHDNIMREVLAGGTLSYQDQELTVDHPGQPAQAWVNLDYSPIVDDAGVVAGVMAVVIDTTARVSAERALHQSEARFAGVAQALPTQVWAAGADGRLDWFNDAVFRYSGHGFDDLVGDGWGRIVYPGDLQTIRTCWTESLATGAVFESEVRLRRADGSYRRHLNRAVPLREHGVAGGRIVGWVGTSTDIEDQKSTLQRYAALDDNLQAQVALRTAERDRMWRLSQDILLVCAFDGRVEAVSPAFSALLGWIETDILGKNFLELVHPQDRGATIARMAALGQGATVHSFENRYRRKDGSWCRLAWTAAPDERFVYAIGRDTTAEREEAERIRRAEHALRQARKMETISKLSGDVAHDFDKLLQTISSNLQLLELGALAEPPGPDDYRHAIENARSALDQGARLAGTLLAFGRRQPLGPQVVQVGSLVSRMEDLLRRALGHETGIDIVVAADLWDTAVDVAQLENVLLNLADNARDAMNQPGHVGIDASNAVLDEAYCRARGDVMPGQYVLLAVTDTGCGMTPEVAARAFEPFFSTKEEGKGTGLGLSMVYGFVRQSGGHVTICSEAGQGTTVRIYLPRSSATEALPGPSTPRQLADGVILAGSA